MSKEIRYLRIDFQNPLSFEELRFFRGAVIKHAGKEHVLFHNHKKDGFRYQYPLIQYAIKNRAPAILCLQDGIEEVYAFFKSSTTHLFLNHRPYELIIKAVYLNKFHLRILKEPCKYVIGNWLALNDKNLDIFKSTSEDQQKKLILSKILTGNILSMGKGVGWHIDEPIELDIETIRSTYPLRWKDATRWGFRVLFQTNVLLPDYIGLGKGASLGYGQVKRWREQHKTEDSANIPHSTTDKNGNS